MLYIPCEEGQALVAYALILAFVALMTLIFLNLLAPPPVGNIFSNITTTL